MATQPSPDQEKTHVFMHKIAADLSGAVVVAMCALGDRLGLFKDLAAHGPASSAELAARAGVNERYAREWLSALASAGYLEYDPTSRRFALPPEHAPARAQEGGPMFVGGIYQQLPAAFGPLDRLAQVFRQGGGVPQAAYDENWWQGMERFTATWFMNLLVQQWIPAVPDIQAKLERGARVADIGCGRGRALITLAQAFPNSHYVGYDSFEPSIAHAKANAMAAGVGDRVSFQRLGIVQGLPEPYDLITTFDVVHDMVNPRGALQAIRRALRPDGTYLMLEINCADKLEDNAGPQGACSTALACCTA
jgi:hypothetical protein